jgi:hypothetical protein
MRFPSKGGKLVPCSLTSFKSPIPRLSHHPLLLQRFGISSNNYNAAALLDTWLHLWRKQCNAGSLWRSWIEETDSRPTENTELGNGCTLSSTIINLSMSTTPADLVTARSLRSASLRKLRCAKKQGCHDSVLHWHDRLQWFHLSSHARSCSFQGSRPCDAAWWPLSNRWMGCSCFHEALAHSIAFLYTQCNHSTLRS